MRGFSLVTVVLCAGPALAEGTLPITVEVLFQSCTYETFGTGCIFYGQGQAFDTNDGFGTEPELMQKLAEVPVNAPLRITGELVGSNDARAVSYLRLTGFEPGPDDPYADLRDLLQGEWLWPDDPTYGLRVTGSEWLSLHAGQGMAMLMLHIAPACPGTVAGAVPVVVLRGYDAFPDEALCLRVDEIDPNRMQVYEVRSDVFTEWRRP